MKGLNRRGFGPNLSNKIRRSKTGTWYECRQCGANYQYRRDARNCSHNKKQTCEECGKMKYTMCVSCKDDGYTICRECCEFGPMPCEIWDSVEGEEEMDAESFEAPRAKTIGGIRISKNPYFPTGTSLQGYVKTNRQELRSAFGNPNMRESDDGKSKGKEWNLYLGGKRVTIYDYREKDKKGTKYFNIGGKEKYAPLLVAQVLSAHTGEYRPAKDIHPQWLEDERRHELVESLDDYPNIDFVKAQEVENNRAYHRMKYNKKNFPNYGAESYGFCAVCNHIGMFQVEDLPVGPRWFCTEKHYAQYAGLPVKESGYYGFEAEREIETEYYARFGDQRGGKEWGTYNFEWFSGAGDWKPLDEDTTGWDEDDFEDFRLEKEYELIHDMLRNPKSGLYRAIENNQTEGTDEEFDTSYQVRDEDGDVVRLDLYLTWGEPFNVQQKIQYYDKEPLYRLEFYADSKKLPPVEKAIDSGIASGATMEGLDLALGAETLTGYRSKTDKRQMLDELAHSIYKKELTSEKVFPGIRVSSKVVLYPDGDTKKERDLSRFQMSMKYSDRMVHQCDNCGIWATSKQTNSWEKDKSREGKKNEIVYYQKDVVNPSEYFGYCVKCYDNLSEKGQLGSNPFSAEEEPPEKDDPLESWMEDFDTEEPSVYWWTKGVIMEKMKDRDLTEDDLVNIIELVAVNAPMDSITKGMREAEQLGDKHIWEILKLAATGRAELLTDDMIHSEKLREYQAEMQRYNEFDGLYCKNCATKEMEHFELYVKNPNLCEDCNSGVIELSPSLAHLKNAEEDEVEMMSCPHCSEFGDGEIPSSVDYDPGDRWEPPSLDVNTWETCEYCDGKGEVEDTPENEKIPTWDWDYLTPDEPDYDRYEGRYDADTYRLGHRITCYYCSSSEDVIHCSKCNDNICGGHRCGSCGNCNTSDCCECSHNQAAESNGDRQLEESIKRTKMSAVRTGLAITTFGIVLWNLWTNKKQEKQISDIMGLV